MGPQIASREWQGRLRLVGGAGANRAMEAEAKRLSSRALGGRLPKPSRPDSSSLSYPFDPELAWLLLRYARTPSRVLWDLAEVEADRLEVLYEGLMTHLTTSGFPWLEPELTFSVEVRRADAFPAGPLQLRGTVKNALVEGSGQCGKRLRLNPNDPQLVFRVEVREDPLRVLLALDLGGRSLHRRGQRLLTAEASLKETLAAQILFLARWDSRHEALVDPMAGAGTFALEATEAAVGASTWQTVPEVVRLPPFSTLDTHTPPLFPGTQPPVACIEIHTPTVRALRRNLEGAGLERVATVHGDFRDVPPDLLVKSWPEVSGLPERGLIVVNPPYGERLEKGRGRDPELEELYEDLRHWWASGFGPGWRMAILGPGRALKAVFGGHPKLDKPMKNGPLSVSLLVYDAPPPAP